jgi:hypothetical protein
MTLDDAIITLQELVGRRAIVKLDGHGAVRVVSVDYMAPPERRCVLGLMGDESLSKALNRPVADITLERRFHEADQVVAAADPEAIRDVLQKQSGIGSRE